MSLAIIYKNGSQLTTFGPDRHAELLLPAEKPRNVSDLFLSGGLRQAPGEKLFLMQRSTELEERPKMLIPDPGSLC